MTHDGYAVFVMDNTGWDALTLYAWGNDLPELFGGWPGISPTGSVEIKGITYKYFDTGEANKGLVYNLIFNDNGVGSQFDGPQNFTLDRDIYLEITESGWTEIDPDAVVIMMVIPFLLKTSPDGQKQPYTRGEMIYRNSLAVGQEYYQPVVLR